MELHTKYDNLDKVLRENFKVSMQTQKREEKLYQRVCDLEETNKELMHKLELMAINQEKTMRNVELYKEENNELWYNHNVMIAKIYTIVTELNYVIAVLNNKHQENYYFLRVL